jgi:hypothetical protein
MKRSLAAVILTCLVTAIFAFGTLADELSFFSPIAGSNPGLTLAGVPNAGAPWVVKHAFATLSDERRVPVDIRGLILPALGTAGPVTAVAASVACSDMVAQRALQFLSPAMVTPKFTPSCKCLRPALAPSSLFASPA